MDDPSRIRKDPDTGLYVNIPARIREIFRRNRFFRFMDIRLDDVSCGHCFEVIPEMWTTPEFN